MIFHIGTVTQGAFLCYNVIPWQILCIYVNTAGGMYNVITDINIDLAYII